MTPKEKAEELVDKFKDYSDPCYHECSEQWELNKSILYNAKQCALIAVDEILTISCGNWDLGNGNFNVIEYWQEVKNEIELL